MRHFNDGEEIRAIDEGQEHLIEDEWIELSDDEVQNILSPEPSSDEKIAIYRYEVGVHIDKKAQELGYDSVATAVTYADEPAVAKFQQEGQALRAWRSQVWEKCYEILAEVEGEIRTAPTVEDLILELPAFVAP